MPTATAAEAGTIPKVSAEAALAVAVEVAACLGGGTRHRFGSLGRRQVSSESVAAFRIGFGLLIAFSAARFLAKGWVGSLYLQPEHHLTYAGFGWVSPLPGPWMHVAVGAIGVSGLAIAAGYRCRPALVTFLALFTYTELIEASLYLNHYWFLTVTALLLLTLPVDRRWSVDARSGRVESWSTVPTFTVWALRAQLAVVYSFAGAAKINGDWILRAEPLRLWFADRADTPLIGFVLAEPATAFAASWAAAFFDLTIVGWLLWRRTRPSAYATLVAFHLGTGALFAIGVFPVVMIVSTLVFFEPDWPSRLRSRLTQSERRVPANEYSAPPRSMSPISISALAAVIAVQVALPLRHYAYPSNVRWSEEGYYLSWRVMLTDKAGLVTYSVTDVETGERWEVDPDLVLTDWQASHAATRPDLIHATALLIGGHYRSEGREQIEVRADAVVSMNGAPAAPIIDPSVDLISQPRSLAPSPWILDRP